MPTDVKTYDTPQKKHIPMTIEASTKLVTDFLSDIKADTYVTRQSDYARIEDAFKLQFYEILATHNDDRNTPRLVS